MKFLIGTKLNMTQIFRENGDVVPVTRVAAGPCEVTQVAQLENGTKAVQVGFGTAKKLNKAQAGHLKGLQPAKYLRQFATDQDLSRGDVLTVASFEAGDRVTVTGTSKGKGFQGVVKRHGFGGSPASHGHKDQLRMPGSIGATDAARVFKGTRMGGHMGDERVTVQNLEVVQIDEEANEIFIKGAVPGARGGVVMLTAKGEMRVVAAPAPEAEAVTEDASTEEVLQDATAETTEAPKGDAPVEESNNVEEAPKETVEATPEVTVETTEKIQEETSAEEAKA